MTLDQLKILDAIVRTGSFRGAAESLYRTQPTLSVAIRNLEAELGFSVLDRSQYRPVLTQGGERIWRQARRVLAQMEELESLGQVLASGVEAELYVVFDALCPTEIIASFLDYFEQHFPQTRLQLSFEYVNGALDRVLHGEAQIALAPQLDLQADLESINLFSVQMIPVASPNFLESLPQPVTLESLEDVIQIVVRDTRTRGPRQDIGVLTKARRWTVSDHSIKLQILRQGIGWGRLPEFLIEEDLHTGRLVSLPERLLPTHFVPVFLMRRHNQTNGPVASQVWDYFRQQTEWTWKPSG